MRRVVSVLSLYVLLISCVSKSSPEYSQDAVLNTTVLKQETLVLMDLAKTESYESVEPRIDAHIAKILVAMQSVEGRAYSEKLVREWELVLDPNEGLVMGFFNYWSTHPDISAGFVDSAKENVAQGYDLILKYERGLE